MMIANGESGILVEENVSKVENARKMTKKINPCYFVSIDNALARYAEIDG